MGNTPGLPPQVDTSAYEGNYRWPDNLYEEIRDMATLSFLVYSFAYLTDVAREFGLKGLEITDQGRIEMPSRDLPRSYSPKEVIEIIENNLDRLKSLSKGFGNEDHDLLLRKLKLLQQKTESSGFRRPLTLEEYDDRHEQQALVYGVTKDDINKRITLVFRGTENNTEARNQNWLHNVSVAKQDIEVPHALEFIVPRLRVHTGFADYIFKPTVDEGDPIGWRKFDEIMEDVKLLLTAHPSYKLYVTGHSLGGALSTLMSLYLASDPEIPKPVTCINFASPRVGGGNFLRAIKWLEEKRWLRMLRVVNDKDTVPTFPMTNYHHVGIQLRLYEAVGEEPKLTYPKGDETYGSYFSRLWQNSVIASVNFSYDHGSYRERVDKDKLFLIKYDLNELYNDRSLTGFATTI